MKNTLENLALQSLVDTIKSTPNLIQEQIINTSKFQLLEEVYEKLYTEITTFVPDLVVEMIHILKKSNYNNRTLIYISNFEQFKCYDEYILEIAFEISNNLLKK